jgi:hypothetical protein
MKPRKTHKVFGVNAMVGIHRKEKTDPMSWGRIGRTKSLIIAACNLALKRRGLDPNAE